MATTADIQHLHYDPTARFEVKHRDVEYRRVGDRSLLAHVYEPQGPGPFPMLIDTHGGGWSRFDRMRNHPINMDLASRGIVVAALDFRLFGEAPHPAAMQDINFAIRWFKSRACDFNGRPEHMGGVGTSSGGHQMMLAGLRPQHAAYMAKDAPADFDAALSYIVVVGCGYDLITTLISQGHAAPFEGYDMFKHLEYFGGVGGIRNESPQHVIESDEAFARPAILLLQAGADDLPGFTNDKALRFVQSYVERGGNIEIAMFPGAGHVFINAGLVDRSEAMERGLAAIRSYISRQLAYLAAPFKK